MSENNHPALEKLAEEVQMLVTSPDMYVNTFGLSHERFLHYCQPFISYDAFYLRDIDLNIWQGDIPLEKIRMVALDVIAAVAEVLRAARDFSLDDIEV